MKMTFAIDLSDFDITDYEKNPIVTFNYDYSKRLHQRLEALNHRKDKNEN